jgi:hypothetical protein
VAGRARELQAAVVRRLLAVLLLVLAVPLTGCVKITNQAHSQQQQIGDVRLTTTFCLSDTAQGATCPEEDTNSERPAGGDHARLLLGYRVPTAVAGPATISVSSTDPAGTLTLSPSPTYTSELQRLAPAPAGQKWVGYISPDVANTDQVPSTIHTATADFALVRGAEGNPYPGPFSYQVVIGERGANQAFTTAPATVACGPSLTAWNSTEQTICSDSPKSPAALLGGTVATKDVGVLNGPTVTAEQGTAISVPFQMRSVGSALPIMNLSAGTTAPAATATSSLSQVQPNATTQNVPVSVDVASNTPPGTYDVTLTATTVSGTQLRVGTWKLAVTAPATPPGSGGGPPGGGTVPQPQPTPPGDQTVPQVTLASAGKLPKLKNALKKGLKFTVTCSEACSAFVTLKSGKTTVGTGKTDKLAPGGKFTVTVKFTKKAQKKYGRAKKLKLKAILAVQDGAGLGAGATRPVTLKR